MPLAASTRYYCIPSMSLDTDDDGASGDRKEAASSDTRTLRRSAQLGYVSANLRNVHTFQHQEIWISEEVLEELTDLP